MYSLQVDVERIRSAFGGRDLPSAQSRRGAYLIHHPPSRQVNPNDYFIISRPLEPWSRLTFSPVYEEKCRHEHGSKDRLQLQEECVGDYHQPCLRCGERTLRTAGYGVKERCSEEQKVL